MKKLGYLKYPAVFILLLAFFYILEINISEGVYYLPLEAAVFAIISEIMIFKPAFKHIFIVLANVLFLLMMGFFVMNRLSIANIFGSLGFGILMISAVFYLTRLIKQGYI